MDRIQVVAVAISVALLVGVLELVRRKKLTEEYSFVWILCALALLGLSLARDVLDRIALSLGIFYPPAALLLVVVLSLYMVADRDRIQAFMFGLVPPAYRSETEILDRELATAAPQVYRMTDSGAVAEFRELVRSEGRDSGLG